MTRLGMIGFLLFVPLNTGCDGADSGEKTSPRSDSAEAAAATSERPDRPGRPTDGGRRTIALGDWPQFLGPHGTGVSDEAALAEHWPAEGPPVVWKKDVGAGYSAPSVLGDRLVVHHRVGDEEVIECLDAATGDSVWRHGYSTDFIDPYGYNGGPRCTPLMTADRCYTFGAAGTVCCLELKTGDEVWRRETAQDFNVPEAFFGVGCSPVLYGDLLIVLVGGQPDSGVVAFDTATGKTVWQAVGKSTWDGATTSDGDLYRWTGEETLVSYASPMLATFDGKDHLLCLMRQGLVSLDPWTGSERFRYWFRSKAHESVNAARPVVIGDRILLTAAYRTGAALLQVKDDGFEELWRDRSNLECHWSTPIVVGEHAYGFSGRHENEGALRCIALKSGEVVWAADGSEPVADEVEPDRFGRGYVRKKDASPVAWPYFGRGSTIVADGKWIILGERGTLFLADVTPDGYRERSRCAVPDIGFPAWAAPVLSRGRLYLRDEDSLVCLDVSKPAAAAPANDAP